MVFVLQSVLGTVFVTQNPHISNITQKV